MPTNDAAPLRFDSWFAVLSLGASVLVHHPTSAGVGVHSDKQRMPTMFSSV
jgi:hypothetical protein